MFLIYFIIKKKKKKKKKINFYGLKIGKNYFAEVQFE